MGLTRQTLQDADGRPYLILKFSKPITAKKLQLGFGRYLSDGVSMRIAEIYFYHYDTMMDEIMALSCGRGLGIQRTVYHLTCRPPRCADNVRALLADLSRIDQVIARNNRSAQIRGLRGGCKGRCARAELIHADHIDHILRQILEFGNGVVVVRNSRNGFILASVDRNPASYYQTAGWDEGGFNAMASGVGLTYEFDAAYKMDTIAFYCHTGYDFYYAHLRYWDAPSDP